MKNRTIEWRRCAGACCLALAIAGVSSFSLAASDDAPAENTQPAEKAAPVDPATKKLMAANGLYTRGLFKLAAEEYAGFLSENPDHPKAADARYALAFCRYQLRQYDKAIEQLQGVLADPKFNERAEALTVMGHSQLSLKHFPQALAAFDELIAKFPTSPRAEMAALNRGQVLYLSKDYAEAAKACQTFLAKYPDSASRPDALYFLALSQRGQNQNGEAVQTLTELTTKYPESSHQIDALLLTGQALESQGKLDPAIEAYEKMLAAAPETRKADAMYSLGIALYKAGKYEEAAKQLLTLATDFPANTYAKPARLQSGLSQLAGKKTDEARATLAAVVRDDPDRANEARYGLAQCDIADKHYEQARQTLGELLNQQPAPPNVAQIALDHAICAMELNQFQPAADELAKLRTQYADAAQIPEAAYRQAFCLHKLGQFEPSHQLCQQVAKMEAPALAAANQELDAEDLYLLAKYPEAQKQFGSLASSTKDDVHRARFIFRQGQCEYFAGNYPKAVGFLETVASDANAAKDPDLQQAFLLLGDAFLQEGKDAQAIAPLKQYLQNATTEKPQAEYKLGIAQLHGKDIEAARASFDRATQGPADSPWVQRAWFERGQVDLKARNFAEASAAFNRVLAVNAPAEIAAPAAYQLGWAEFGAKQFPQAAAAWKAMAAKYPADKLAPDAEFEQGVALHEAKQYDEAAAALQAYAAAHPDGQYSTKARQLAAASFKELGKNDQAEKMLAALANDTKGAGADSVLYDLAWAQQDAKDPSAAQATYRRLLQDHPESKLIPTVRTELAFLLYNEKKYDEAAALLEKVVADPKADDKTLSDANFRLAWCYKNSNKPDKAAAIFAAYTLKGGGTDEMKSSALLQAGLAYATDQKYEKAAQELTEMLTRYPTQKDAPVAMLKLGEVQALAQNYEASGRTYQEFLQKYPTSEFAYRAQFGIGWSLENQKKYDDARAAYQKVIAATNTETAARAQFQIGETLLAEGKFEKAVQALLAVDDVYKYPQWSARALWEAGRAFEQLKESDQARKQYTDITTRFKNAPEAGMAQDRLKSMAGS